MPLALGLAATSAAGVSPGPRGDDVGSGAVTAAGNGLGGTRSSWVCSEPAHGLTIDATSMTAASAMTAIGRRLARRTGTGSTRNGGDVMATVCVWLSTLEVPDPGGGAPGWWAHGTTPTALHLPAWLQGGRRPTAGPRLCTGRPALLAGWDPHRGGRGQVATDVANHLRLRPSWQPCARSVSHAARLLGPTGASE